MVFQNIQAVLRVCKMIKEVVSHIQNRDALKTSSFADFSIERSMPISQVPDTIHHVFRDLMRDFTAKLRLVEGLRFWINGERGDPACPSGQPQIRTGCRPCGLVRISKNRFVKP
jgi:hypothetical protein